MKALATMLAVLLWCAGCATRITRSDELTGVRDFLQGFTNQCAKGEENIFFVSSVFKDDGREFAYAYWMTENAILPLEMPTGAAESYLWDNAHRIDLDTGVVPTREDVGSSTYLVDSDWVAKILRSCLDSGTKFVVKKKA